MHINMFVLLSNHTISFLLFLLFKQGSWFILGGLIANSLAVVSDASHLACDLAGFLVSLFAIWIAKKPPTRRMSFGYHRAGERHSSSSVELDKFC